MCVRVNTATGHTEERAGSPDGDNRETIRERGGGEEGEGESEQREG